MKKVLFEDIGASSYKEVWDYQEKLLHENVEHKRNGEYTTNYLLFTEHAPVYTLGKNGNTMHVLVSEQQRKPLLTLREQDATNQTTSSQYLH